MEFSQVSAAFVIDRKIAVYDEQTIITRWCAGMNSP